MIKKKNVTKDKKKTENNTELTFQLIMFFWIKIRETKKVPNHHMTLERRCMDVETVSKR